MTPARMAWTSASLFLLPVMKLRCAGTEEVDILTDFRLRVRERELFSFQLKFFLDWFGVLVEENEDDKSERPSGAIRVVGEVRDSRLLSLFNIRDSF
jgi:hypothetical protein